MSRAPSRAGSRAASAAASPMASAMSMIDPLASRDGSSRRLSEQQRRHNRVPLLPQDSRNSRTIPKLRVTLPTSTHLSELGSGDLDRGFLPENGVNIECFFD